MCNAVIVLFLSGWLVSLPHSHGCCSKIHPSFHLTLYPLTLLAGIFLLPVLGHPPPIIPESFSIIRIFGVLCLYKRRQGMVRIKNHWTGTMVPTAPQDLWYECHLPPLAVKAFSSRFMYLMIVASLRCFLDWSPTISSLGTQYYLTFTSTSCNLGPGTMNQK